MWGTFRVRNTRLYISASRLESGGDGMRDGWEVRGERWKQEASQGGAVEKQTRASEFVRVYVNA